MAPSRAPRVWTALVTAALLLGLVGCSGASPASSSENADGPAPAAPATEAKADASGSGAATTAERQVAKTASMTLLVDDPAAAAKRARQTAEALGGYLLSENVVTEQKDGLYVKPSTVTVAVPSAKLDDSLDAFAMLGNATYRTVTAEDVTTQVVDLDARIRVLRESIARVEQLMNKAGSISQVAQVEAELTSRQSDLESLLAKQRALAGRVEMAPVTITLKTPVTAVSDPNPWWQGLASGWQALQTSLRVLLVVIGALVPFVALGLLVALPIIWWRRRQRLAQPAPDRGPTSDQGPAAQLGVSASPNQTDGPVPPVPPGPSDGPAGRDA